MRGWEAGKEHGRTELTSFFGKTLVLNVLSFRYLTVEVVVVLTVALLFYLQNISFKSQKLKISCSITVFLAMQLEMFLREVASFMTLSSYRVFEATVHHKFLQKLQKCCNKLSFHFI